MLMCVPCCATFLSRQNIQGHTPKSEVIDWRQHLTDACQPAVLDRTSICICTPDSENWIHNKCRTEFHKPWWTAFLSLHYCSALLWGSAGLQSFRQGCSRATRRTQRDCRGRKAHLLHHRSSLVTSGSSGPHSHRDTLPPCGNHSSSPRQLGKDAGRRLAASPMLSGHRANAAANHMHFGAVLKKGAVNLIYWD